MNALSVMSLSVCSSAFFVALVATTHAARAVEIPGKVLEAGAGVALVEITEDVVPQSGDPVVIYFTLPGTEDEVLVGKAVVVSVSDHIAKAKLDDPDVIVQQGQLARISSAAPIRSICLRSRPILPVSEVEKARARAEGGDVDAMRELARYHDPSLNKSGAANADEAVKWYQKAAEKGDARAAVNLAMAYNTGMLGLNSDPAKALELGRPVAEKGDPRAAYQVAFSLEDSVGARDPAEAVKFYRKAAEAGVSSATARLALAHRDGALGIEKNEKEAVRLLKVAAEQGAPEAQYDLARMYGEGTGGLPRDEQGALELYRAAADSGVSFARYGVGLLYLNGEGGLPKDEAEALRLFQLAAAKEHPRSLYALARMHLEGKGGLAPDRAKALEYARAAAAKGEERAKELVATLEARPEN